MRGIRTGDAALRAAAVVLLAVTAGCGAAPPESPPSGVDELVVPTPSPDPGDFVEVIDNPWLPLRPGAVWTRRVTTEAGSATETTRVLPGTRSVAGVAATEVRTERSGAAAEQVAWFAQDDRGNVWSLGEEGEWEAGTDGALAGLAMPASPRRGDGFARWAVADDPQEVVRVGERETAATVAAGRFTDLLETTTTTPDGVEWQVYHSRGVGEVLRLRADEAGRAELVEHQPGQ